MKEMIEEWDWEKARPTGKAVSREKAHKEGIPHEGVHLWIVRKINEYPEILFQYRAKQKEQYPDCLDITVGGHVPFGKTENKIQKESYEEIGISPGDEELIDLGYYRYEEFDGDMIHREFQRVYLFIDNRPLNGYSFIDGEVEGIYAFSLSDIELLLKGAEEIKGEGFNGENISTKLFSRKTFHPLLFSDTMEEYMKVVISSAKELIKTGAVTTKMPAISVA